MFWSLLFLAALVVAIVWLVRGRRPAPPPDSAYQATPVPSEWGRQPTQSQQAGMGGQAMGGLATGLAIGASALAAQEVGRHMMDDDRSRHGGSAADSDLAHDAGLGSVGIDDSASSDDGGGFDGGDGGGGDS